MAGSPFSTTRPVDAFSQFVTAAAAGFGRQTMGNLNLRLRELFPEPQILVAPVVWANQLNPGLGVQGGIDDRQHPAGVSFR